MAPGQPVSQNHMNPNSLTTDSLPWDTFAYTDNKPMTGNDEASAQRQRDAAMIPIRNDPRQASTTPNSATTPINNTSAYQQPAGGYGLNDHQYQQSYNPNTYSLAQQQQQQQQQAQYLQRLNQQQQLFHPQQLAQNPFHGHHIQQQISSVGYPPPVSEPAVSNVLDPSLYPQYPGQPSASSGPEPARRPNKSPKHARKSSKQGPLHDSTARVQKRAPKSPASAPPHQLKFTGLYGDWARLYHKFMGEYGTFHESEEESPEVDFESFINFAKDLRSGIKAESMSREHTAIERHVRGVSSTQDDPINTIALSPNTLATQRKEIARLYRWYQKEFRPRVPIAEHKYKCTLGCLWSHKTKSNWERHERTHYPQEIWICCHEGCQDKSAKTRVSFRKDLARRHHFDHHQGEYGPPISDKQLDELKVRVSDSFFPRNCVFQDCPKTFTTFDERSTHMENHLKNGDILVRESIVKNYPNDAPQSDSDHDGDHDMDTSHETYRLDPEATEPYDDDGDGDGDDENEDGDDDNDGGAGGIITKRHPDDRDDGAGAGGTGSNLWNNAFGGAGPSSHTSNTYQHQGYSPMSGNAPNYMLACNFDTFGGSGHIPAIDKRPWKTTTSLRLQLLPQAFSRGIAQTPIVLKKIQLQAALMLDLSSVKKTQIVNILRREIAMMAGALPVSSGPSIKRFPHLTAMTKMLPSLTKTASRIDMSCMAKQNQAILKFAGFRKDILSQELEDPGGEDDDEESADPLRDRLTHFEGGHIYRCLPIHSSMTPIRPSRLVHVGTKNKPILHLDTSDALPSQVNYCSLSHCWDDGYGLCLSKENVTSLKQSIPADCLTQSFHVAINIARERGLEYLWIDTLCIIQDSDEDIQAEVPRITQIHASATFAIVITSVAYDGITQQCDECVLDDNALDEKSEEQSMPETPELTIGDTVETELDASNKTTQKDTAPVEIVRQLPERRDSHQLESFLAEGPKRSFFSPLPAWSKISLPQSLSPVSSHSKFDLDRQADESDEIHPDKRPSRVVHYLDKWRFRWQKLSTQAPPLSSAASVVTTSPIPSISDRSVHSEKKKHPILVLPVSFEKLFRGFRSRHVHDTDLDNGSSSKR